MFAAEDLSIDWFPVAHAVRLEGAWDCVFTLDKKRNSTSSLSTQGEVFESRLTLEIEPVSVSYTFEGFPLLV